MTGELWLTEIRIDQRHSSARGDLRSITSMHRTVMSMFPQAGSDSARSEHGVLHRLDSTGRGPVLLVQSSVKPDTAAIAPGYGNIRSVSLVPLLERLRPGTVIRYRILANATKKSAVGNTKGKRIALGAGPARNWWERHSSAAGLAVDPGFTLVSESLTGREADDGKITVRPWRIDGIASVEDPAALDAAIRAGIGRARAYGCGLLTLAIGTASGDT